MCITLDKIAVFDKLAILLRRNLRSKAGREIKRQLDYGDGAIGHTRQATGDFDMMQPH